MIDNTIVTIEKNETEVCELTCNDFDITDPNSERKNYRVDFNALTEVEKATLTDAIALLVLKRVEIV